MNSIYHYTSLLVQTTRNFSFLGFPPWYKYIEDDDGSINLDSIYDFWLIAAALLEMIMRLAAIIAVAYFIYNGFRLMTSQGNPERISQARTGLLHATIGLVITISATAIVSLVAGAIK